MGTLIPPLQPFVPQPQTNQNHHHHFQPPPPSSSSLSLWMGQDIAPPQPQPQDYDWVFGNAKAASACIDNNNNHDELITQTANASSTTTTTLSIPSLFSSDQTQNANANANMSATALLQKAAEIGATSTTTAVTNDPSTFLQSFPLKSSDQTTTYDGGEKFFALFGSNNNNIGLISHTHDQEIENARNDVTVASALDELQNYPWKRRRVDGGGGGEGGGGGQTRDFLGVGVQTLCHPSSNGWI